jgi:NADH-quinone oxidoreductase subunit F
MSDLDLNRLHSALEEIALQGRPGLLPALQTAQEIYGYLPEPVAAEVGRILRVPLVDVYGVIDFYSMLYREPVGRTVLRVCDDPACALAGSGALLESLGQRLEVDLDQVSADGSITLERSPCLGLCEHAPAVLAGTAAVPKADPNRLEDILNGNGSQVGNTVAGDVRLLTENCGAGQPADLRTYQAGGGYQGLKKALSLTPQEVIGEVKTSGLVGRGGAAFPTGVKWEGAAQAPGEPKYLVCNADESEPGTFKDRVLMEGDPHRTLEGMIIAGYAVGAKRGYLYVRGEYPQAADALRRAVEEAQSNGFLGQGILGSDFDFEVEIRLGAGAYICGEETALFESIEGKRGFPRVKPPFPTTNGLFGKPTAINNVETLCNVPFILSQGADKYRRLGTQKSPGTKLFCLSGDVVRPGLYEVPFGVTLRHLLFDLAGGIKDGGELGAVLLGGAAGTFAAQDKLDVRLTFEDLQAAGLSLGSGVAMVFDQRRDLRDVLLRLARFFAHESCGKCYPCQIGTQRQYEILQRLASGDPLPGDRERLEDVGWTMSDASLCGLGQTAATALLSAMDLWPELFNGNSRV